MEVDNIEDVKSRSVEITHVKDLALAWDFRFELCVRHASDVQFFVQLFKMHNPDYSSPEHAYCCQDRVTVFVAVRQ